MPRELEEALALAACLGGAAALAYTTFREVRRLLGMEAQVQRDALTHLFNRRHAVAAMHEAFTELRYAPMSAILVDVDHFKHVNDAYGHDAGDAVLCALGRVLRECIRPHDVAARWGGEEFLIFMPGATAKVACARAERIRARIEALSVTTSESPAIHVTASFGVASYPEHGLHVDALCRCADVALYSAKARGRNCVVLGTPSTRPPA